jgi:hypothetical protein
MKNKKQIKVEAELLLENLKFKSAFEKLWELGPKEVVNEVCQKSWSNEEAIPHFWDSLFSNNRLQSLIRNRKFINFLVDKIKNSVFENQTVIQRMYNISPQEIVEIVRTYQVFTTKIGLSNISNLLLNQEDQYHLLVWTNLYNEVNRISNLISSYKNDLSAINSLDVFNELVVWLERKRFQIGSNNQSIQLLSEVYSFFIECLLNDERPDLNSLNKFNIEEFRVKTFSFLIENTIELKEIHEILEFCFESLNFKNQVLNRYSYDSTCKIYFEDSTFHIKDENDSEYYWILDGFRYTFCSILGQQNATNFVLDSIERGEMLIPEGKSPNDVNINFQLACNKYATLDLMRKFNLSITKSFKSENVNLLNVITSLNGLSMNRGIRYELPILNDIIQGLKPSESFSKLYHDFKVNGIINESLLFIHVDDFKNSLSRGGQISDIEFSYLINQFGYKLSLKKNQDWFKVNYDVFIQPFLIINNFVLCPTMFIANNVFYYSFVQNQLTINKGKEEINSESKNLEINLLKAFKRRGFIVQLINNNSNLYAGDADLLIKDTNIILVIQLKRTYLRVNLEDMFWEDRIVSEHGREQLIKIMKDEKFRLDYKLDEFIVTPWLVTTSFEGINRNDGKIKKINYLELLNALNNPGIKNLQDLIQNVESDENIKLWLKSVENI